MFGLGKNVVFSVFIFSFLWDPPQKTLVWLCFLYLVFIFNIQKIAYNFWVFSFFWKWISWHFRLKRPNFMGPTNTKLSSLSLSLSLSQWWWWSIDESDPWLMLTGSGLLLGVVVFLWIGLLKWLWWLFVLRHIWWWI